jgi:hypothetical protein|tara:strand:- start:22437 stop:23000 length:564 start_codon:yes stop_codon:yes gene_type:complete
VRSPYNFIVKSESTRRYDNVKEIGGIEFITSVSEEDHTVSNRFATVMELPIDYGGPVQKGDTLLVHHNVFKFYNDMKGRQKSGRSYFKDDLFFVDYDQFFLYKHKDKWSAHGKYCFIKPSELKDSYILKPGAEEPLLGVVKYINQELIDLGVKEGDEISFEPESEYPFTVDGEKLYRMFTNNITMTL